MLINTRVYLTMGWLLSFSLNMLKNMQPNIYILPILNMKNDCVGEKCFEVILAL